MSTWIQRTFYIIAIGFFTSTAWGASVLAVKGKAALIRAGSGELKTGQTYYLVKNNKKYGLVKVMKQKPGKAIGKVLKGRALKGFKLQLRKSPTKRTTVKKTYTVSKPKRKDPLFYSRGTRAYKKRPKEKNFYFGLAMGYNQNSAAVSFYNSTNGQKLREGSHSGSNISYEALFGYRLTPRITAQVSLGMHNFSAEQEEADLCPDKNNQLSLNCFIDVNYFNLDFWGKYNFALSPNYQIWAGLGLGVLLSPKFNETTSLESGAASTTTLMQVGLGGTININAQFALMAWTEYGMFPSSDTVNMSSISGYGGLVYLF